MILVAGLPYSGTTMLVDILEALGVHMGESEHLDTNTGEDRLMAYTEGNAFAAERTRRDGLYPLWGYKDPYAYRKNNYTLSLSDKVIVIFRDPIAMRRHGSVTFNDLQIKIDDIVKAYTWATNNSSLMLSYEKTVLFPERTIRQLASFIGVEVSDDSVKQIAATIVPERGHRNDAKGAHSS